MKTAATKQKNTLCTNRETQLRMLFVTIIHTQFHYLLCIQTNLFFFCINLQAISIRSHSANLDKFIFFRSSIKWSGSSRTSQYFTFGSICTMYISMTFVCLLIHFHFPKSKSHINLCQSHENPITTGNSSQFPQFLCQLCNLSRLFTQKLFTYCFYFLLRKIETSGVSWTCVGNCDNFNLPHISVWLSKLDLFIR